MKKLISAFFLSILLASVCSAQTFSPDVMDRGPAKFVESVEIQTTSSLGDLLAEVFIDMWFVNTVLVTFDDYPYANGSYIRLGSMMPTDTDIFSEYDDESKPKVNQYYRFAVDTSFFFLPGLMVGNETRFEGMLWKFFGPIFQIDTFTTTDSFSGNREFKSLDTNLQLGLELSIVQTNPFALYWAFCWQRIQYRDLPVSSGISLQLIARSYPASPVLIEWRGTIAFMMLNGKPYSPKFNWESHLEIGMMMRGPLEVFAAWRYFAYEDLGAPANGVEIGVRYHF